MKLRKTNTAAAAMLVLLSVVSAIAQTTEFPFEGRIPSNGFPQNSTYDIEFRLYDSASGGTQLANLEKADVAVEKGVFKVTLNFGSQFDGGPRWIEVGIAASATEGYFTLEGRTEIKSVPYAIRSLTSGSTAVSETAINAENLGGLPAAEYVVTGDPRLSDPRPPVAGNSNYIQNTTTLQSGSSFNIDGVGKALSFDVESNFKFRGHTFLSSAQPAGSIAVAIGSTKLGSAAGHESTGGDNTLIGYFAGNSLTTSAYNTLVGSRAGRNVTSGYNSIFGADAGTIISGEANSVFGAFAAGGGLEASVPGNHNSFIGYLAGSSFRGGNANSYFGTWAGFRSGGNLNSFLGFEAGFNSNGRSGDFNTFVGARAGKFTGEDTVVHATSSTLLGHNTQILGSGRLFATAIGAGSVVDTDNTIVLGRPGGEDSVKIPGPIRVNSLAIGDNQVCINEDGFLIRCVAAKTIGKTHLLADADSRTLSTDKLLRALAEQDVQLREQRRKMEELTRLVCELKPEARTCLRQE